MIKSICHIVNYNLYETKRYFTQKLHEACLRKGIKSFIVDTPDGVLEISSIEKIIRERPDFTCSFNSLLPMPNGQFLADQLCTPHLAFLVDPPIYVMDLIKSPYCMVSCVDRFDCDVVKAAGFPNVFFFPHAIDRELATDPGRKRSLDVVFLGSCYDYENLRKEWQQKYPPEVAKVIENAIDISLSGHLKTFIQALVEAWNGSGLDPAGFDFKDLCFYVDNYVRGWDRVSLVRAIKDVPVHIYGGLWDNEMMVKGWDYYLKGQKNVIVNPAVSFDQSLEILKDSKISLNSIPFFRNGSHERIFNGLAAGAVVVTTDNLYVKEQFSEEEGIVLYEHKRWDQVNESIDEYLKHEGKRHDVVLKGQNKVLKSHTWDNRVELLQETLPPILIDIS